jgi:hypothetical protein
MAKKKRKKKFKPRKPVAKICNKIMRSKKDYNRQKLKLDLKKETVCID